MKSVGQILDGKNDEELQGLLDRLGEKISARQDEVPQEEPKPQTAKIIQLPLWPEPKRGVPNSALRGALFAAIQGKDRQALKGDLLFAQQGIEIRFTGWQLDQSDLDVWEQALHLARQNPLGTQCHFTAHGFLKALGRSTGKANHKWLKDVFRRLGAAFVEITHNGKTYADNLLGFLRDEDSGRYILEITPKIMALYAAGWTAIDWEQRRALGRKPLALWLHGFYATHANPRPLTVQYMHKLCGSRNQDIRGFKRDLKKAHEALVSVGTIRDFEIKDGLVSVDNVPSSSQQKHLKKARRCRKK